MFDIPNYDKTNRASMNSAEAQISTAKSKSVLATILSGTVLVGGAVAVINGVVNAEYVNMAAQIGAVVPEAAVSLVGGSGVIAHAVYNARLKKAKKKVEFDIAVDDEVKRRTRRP
jgi:uncharacterized membrane-anchored protein